MTWLTLQIIKEISLEWDLSYDFRYMYSIVKRLADLHTLALISVHPNEPEIEGFQSKYVVGESVNISCKVDGGVPHSMAVNFSCPGHPDQKDTVDGGAVVSAQSFRVDTADNSSRCVCYGDNSYTTSINVFNHIHCVPGNVHKL